MAASAAIRSCDVLMLSALPAASHSIADGWVRPYAESRGWEGAMPENRLMYVGTVLQVLAVVPEFLKTRRSGPPTR
jgi:hypothetical protein